MKEQTGKWDRFWRSFNPPLPDVMQKRMLRTIRSNRRMPHNLVDRIVTRVSDSYLQYFPTDWANAYHYGKARFLR